MSNIPNIPFLMPTAMALPVAAFNNLLCPCVYAGGSANGQLPQLGSAQRNCLRCSGVGVYWDNPSVPFKSFISFTHMSPTPDEPGVRMNENYGMWQTSEPSMTVPYQDPTLAVNDPGQPTTAWTNMTSDDQIIIPDMTSRYTAVLQVGVKENLPFQQNLDIALTGAVTVWNPATSMVETVQNYAVNGPTVTIGGYAPGTNYMVEFTAAAVYVVFRAAGGLAHIRPLGGGTVNEPRRFRLQALDFWTRQRGVQPQVAGTVQLSGTMRPYTPMVGQVVAGS